MKTFVLALVATLALTFVAPIAQAQYPVAHSHNNFGVHFWGSSPQAALYICRTHTPYGGVCFFDGIW